MANLKEVRERIVSVSSTQQITKAMKMVSAAKLRRAQNAITQMRPYAIKLGQILSNVMESAGSDSDIALGAKRDVVHPLIVVVTSNRGLCGAFNTNIIKAAIATIEGKYRSQYEAGHLHLMCIGKKAADFLTKRYPKATFHNDDVEIFNDLRYERVYEIAEQMLHSFVEGEVDVIHVAYGRFRNAAMQFAEIVPFAPIAPPSHDTDNPTGPRADYIYEPGQEELLEDLIPMIMKTQFFRYLLDTHASEHGARMTAMDKATENAEDLKKELKITYNKARQEAITRELSEIVGGAAALGG